MISLIYVSRTRVHDDQRAQVLDDILLASIARNSTLDITGLLISTIHHFAQLLEGPDVGVDGVMASILADPRHHEVRVICRSDVAERRYPLWQMARFEGRNFGNACIAPLLAEAHAQDDPQASRRLERLIEAIALDRFPRTL